MSPRPRQQILDNLDSVYREAYERAKAAKDDRRMADLDAAYQREQLLLEVLLDIRDGISGADLTPYLLRALGEATNYRALDANIALLRANAQVAAQLALTLCA